MLASSWVTWAADPTNRATSPESGRTASNDRAETTTTRALTDCGVRKPMTTASNPALGMAERATSRTPYLDSGVWKTGLFYCSSVGLARLEFTEMSLGNDLAPPVA